MRLNAYLARAGIASRRGAEALIRAGRVTVNGEVACLATFVEGEDRVEVDGAEVGPEPLTYVLLHKPAGVVTTPRGLFRITVTDASGRTGAPSTRTSSPSETTVASPATSPFTVTRPERMSASAPRREAMPARAR